MRLRGYGTVVWRRAFVAGCQEQPLLGNLGFGRFNFLFIKRLLKQSLVLLSLSYFIVKPFQKVPPVSLSGKKVRLDPGTPLGGLGC